MKKPRVIMFDMDDTLFPEKHYVLSGLKSVSIFLEDQFDLDANSLYDFLQSRFEEHGRDRIFNYLLEENKTVFGGINTNSLITELVQVYRRHIPDINLSSETINILKEIRHKNIKIVIVTDGMKIMQENKVHALRLHELADEVVYCWECNAAKPSLECFRFAARKVNSDIKECIFVGDNPTNDITPARMLGMRAYRIRSERFCNMDDNFRYPPIDSFLTLGDFFQKVIKDEY